MTKLFSFIGATAGGYAGWFIAEGAGFFAAFVVSMIGTGVGMYYGRKYAKDHFE